MAKTDISFLLAICVVMCAAAPQVQAAVAFEVEPFELGRVRLLAGPFKDAQERDRKYLHDLDADRLLHTFRVNAGLPSDAEPLGGWERPDCEVRGHTMGHYLSACAMMAAATGDDALRAKAEGIVAALAECQNALGDSGYLSAFPETWIDRVETLKPVWAPYYTLHKIYAGLMDVHHFLGNEQALEIAEKMAAWNRTRLARLSEEQMQQILNRTEQGGMNEAFANLSALTGNDAYLQLARRFDQKTYTEPLLNREDRLKGQHVNSFIPNMIGTAQQYELTGNPADRHIAEFFWDQVVNHRSYCTGGTSDGEHWRSDPDELARQLSDHTQETCCTYNMLKLTRHLFTWDPDGRYADYYERALINSILSTQNPRTGMMMYFVPLAPGRWKMFNRPNDSFWCCTGTGLENHARYGEAVYFHKGDRLFVNLFMASRLDWRQKRVQIVQQTGFPASDATALTVRTAAPTRIELCVRWPYWATRGVLARLNGESVALRPTASRYLVLDRTWKSGDRLELRMPMSLHVHPMPDDPTLTAFMYGPLVLAGELGGEGLTDENTHTQQNWYKFPQPIPTVPPMIVDSDNVTDWLKRVPGRDLAFQTVVLEEPIRLVPYHRLFDQRYVVYWRVLRKGSRAYEAHLARERERQELLARTIDSVVIGDAESEKAHGMESRDSRTGVHEGRPWRDAAPGGWFSYRLAIAPDEPTILRCTYWGSDVGRTFDVIVAGEKIAVVTLNNNAGGEFFHEDYEFPPSLVRGCSEITVRFAGHSGSIAGGVFGCATLKEKP